MKFARDFYFNRFGDGEDVEEENGNDRFNFFRQSRARAAAAEIRAIQARAEADEMNRIFTPAPEADQERTLQTMGDYMALFEQEEPDVERISRGDFAKNKLAKSRGQEATAYMMTPVGAKGGKSNQYADPYADITNDVRSTVDQLMADAASAKFERSPEDRQNAITGLVNKLTGGRPNYSNIREEIKTPSYESFMGAGNTFDRAAGLMSTTRDAAEARRKNDSRLLDDLMDRIKL